MGIDIYAKWQEQTDDERGAQTADWLSTDGGRIGYLREAYHGEPYATQYLCEEVFGGQTAQAYNDAAKVTKQLGDLSVGLQSLQIVNGGRQYLLTMTLANKSAKKSVWVAMSGGMVGNAHQTVTDPNGYDFVNADRDVSGVASTLFQVPSNAFTQATEIKPGDSIPVTIRLFSMQSRNATAGQCNVQLGFLTGDDFNNGYGQCTQQSVDARMDAE